MLVEGELKGNIQVNLVDLYNISIFENCSNVKFKCQD